MVAITVNGQRKDIDVDAGTPLLWVLREHLKMTGTKFGCGIAACGGCTVHVDGAAVRSCITPVGTVAGRSVTTMCSSIESRRMVSRLTTSPVQVSRRPAAGLEMARSTSTSA